MALFEIAFSAVLFTVRAFADLYPFVEIVGVALDGVVDLFECWELRQGFLSTFQKFVLYSKHNVFAGRQATWHYGILKQYLILLPFALLAVLHSFWWLIIIFGWILARTTKTILTNGGKSRFTSMLNPLIFLGVMLLILTIDFAAFIGWGQAIFQKEKGNSKTNKLLF